jgi:hypothetical protein
MKRWCYVRKQPNGKTTMIRSAFIAAAALAAIAGSAAAQGGMSANPPTETTLCLDVNGQSLPAVCTVPSSRLDKREDICLCHAGTRVTAPVCPEGVKPHADDIAFDKARKAAAKDGTLVGDLYQGQPMCVAPRMTH